MNLVWFRNDLRVDDNPALSFATADKSVATVAVYLLCSRQFTLYGVGKNQQALVISALENLSQNLRKLNIKLLIIEADTYAQSPAILKNLCQQLKVSDLYFNVEYPLDERRRDEQLVASLADQVKCHSFIGDSLVAPWKVVNAQDEGYKVFSAFARRAYAALDSEPLMLCHAPAKKSSANLRQADHISALEKLPFIKSEASSMPNIEESMLKKQLDNFCNEALSDYAVARDFPAQNGTAKLSSALAIGTLSVRRCFETARQIGGNAATTWLNELMWRDFYRAVVWHYPHVCKGKAFNSVDTAIGWSYEKDELTRWTNGETGIPIVDAAMRQLATTGWMHNRLRMVVASYLTKNLFIDWRLGEKVFAKYLFDYDFSSNNGGWQWSASVGTDAAPYFRVFNPANQQKRFDPDAQFIKQWLPQLANLSAASIHKFETKPLAGYFKPQVDLKFSRQLAIDHFKQAKMTQTE